jgi:hypothetical protein
MSSHARSAFPRQMNPGTHAADSRWKPQPAWTLWWSFLYPPRNRNDSLVVQPLRSLVTGLNTPFRCSWKSIKALRLKHKQFRSLQATFLVFFSALIQTWTAVYVHINTPICLSFVYNFLRPPNIDRRKQWSQRNRISMTINFHSRSQSPHGLRRKYAAASTLGLRVRMPLEAWIFACCECCVLSGGGLCDGLIARPEEFYRLWCV